MIFSFSLCNELATFMSRVTFTRINNKSSNDNIENIACPHFFRTKKILNV